MVLEISRREMIKLGSVAGLLALTGGVGAAEIEHGGYAHAAGEGLPEAYADGRYTLPALPYAYNALEPLYEERILKIHHDKHHAGYVRGLNKTLDKLEAARKANDYSSIKSLSRALAFHGSGHVLHSLFWHSMKPGGSKPPAALAKAMTENFGSVQICQTQFAAATKKVEASGWGVLAYEPVGRKLLIMQVEKHQNLGFWGVVPLLVCDVWEHAYYLQFANNRGAWITNFMKLANWEFAARRYYAARGIHTG